MSALGHPGLPLPEGLDGSRGRATQLSPACPSGATPAPMLQNPAGYFVLLLEILLTRRNVAL